NCPNLQVLLLNGCSKITNDGVQILSCHIGGSSNCPEMQTLGLSGTKITNQAFKYLFEFCPNLHSLDLSHCKHITDEGVIGITEAYRQNLQSLSLQGCLQLTDA